MNKKLHAIIRSMNHPHVSLEITHNNVTIKQKDKADVHVECICDADTPIMAVLSQAKVMDTIYSVSGDAGFGWYLYKLNNLYIVYNTYDDIREVLAPMHFGDEVKLSIMHFNYIVKFGSDGFTVFETDITFEDVYRGYPVTPSLKEAVYTILT